MCPGHLPPSPRAPARAAPRLRLTGGAPAGHRAARSGAEASPPPSPAAHVLKPVPAAASDHSSPGRHGPIPTHTLVSAAGGKAVLPVPPRPWGMPVASASPVTGERAHTRHTPLSGPLPHPFQVELKQPRGTPPRPLSEHLAESPLGLARGNRWHSALRPRADAAFCRGPTSSCTTREGLAQGPPPGSGLGIIFLKLSGTTQELATSALRTTPVYT